MRFKVIAIHKKQDFFIVDTEHPAWDGIEERECTTEAMLDSVVMNFGWYYRSDIVQKRAQKLCDLLNELNEKH